MITVMMIPNAEKFLNVVANSCGKVLLHLPNGGQCDLKRDRFAKELLRTMRPGEEGLQISLSNPDDTLAFLRYMQEASL